MTDILLTMVVEQVSMIGLAVALILSGFYVLGAVIGTVVGFGIAACSAVLIRNSYLGMYLMNIKKPKILLLIIIQSF